MTDWHTLREQAHTDALAVFGQDVTYTPQGGQSETVKGVFYDESTHVDETGRAGVQSVQPHVDVQLSVLSESPEVDDEVTVDGSTYTVMEVRRDGQGGARLILGWAR